MLVRRVVNTALGMWDRVHGLKLSQLGHARRGSQVWVGVTKHGLWGFSAHSRTGRDWGLGFRVQGLQHRGQADRPTLQTRQPGLLKHCIRSDRFLSFSRYGLSKRTAWLHEAGTSGWWQQQLVTVFFCGNCVLCCRKAKASDTSCPALK